MIQRIFFNTFRACVWAALHVFYRQIRVSGLTRVPQGPVLFAVNHQNAFMDALLVVCSSGRYVHFLARADIFKKKWARRLLRYINMIPIYRMRDGWQSLTKNQQTFELCSQVLEKQHSILIFPEGNHSSARRLRPLSKGFTRVAFELLRVNPTAQLHVIPVGLNYTDAPSARSAVHIIYGDPLSANHFFKLGEQQAALALRKAVGESLQKLITHIPEGDARVESELNSQPVDYLEPEKINAWIADKSIPLPLHGQSRDWAGFVFRIFLFPVIVMWRLIDKKIDDRVFVASLKFAFVFAFMCCAMVTVIAWLLVYVIVS